MYPFKDTVLENQHVFLNDFSDFLGEYGFELGGSWETTRGFFDKKLEQHPGYLYLRIPVYAEQGAIDEEDAVLKIGTPFLLRHLYQSGLDDYVDSGVLGGSLNQFSEPIDKDASLQETEIERARKIIHDVDQGFRQQFFH